MQRLYKILIAIGILGMIVFLCPFAFYWKMPVHMSIDDVTALERLSGSDNNSDIFNDPLLHLIRDCHNSTGAKFTLYVYETSVKELPQETWVQIQDNADWLRIGFHAVSVEQPESLSDEEFISSYCRLDSILTAAAPQNKASTLRLHYWAASPLEVSFMEDKGIKCLLAADRNTVSYSLSPEDNSYLQKNEFLEKNGMTYKKTDFRVEKASLLPALVKNATDEELVVFTHEWALDGDTHNLMKFSILMSFLHFYGAVFEY